MFFLDSIFLFSYLIDDSLQYVYDTATQMDIPFLGASPRPRLDISTGYYMWDVAWWSLSLGYPVGEFNVFGGTEGFVTEFPVFDEYGEEESRFYAGEFLVGGGISRCMDPVNWGAMVELSYESLGGGGKVGTGISLSAAYSPVGSGTELGLSLSGIGFSLMSPMSLSIFGEYVVSHKYEIKLVSGAGFTLIKRDDWTFLFDSASLSMVWADRIGLVGSFGGLNTGFGIVIKPLEFYSGISEKFKTPLPKIIISSRYSLEAAKVSIEIRISQIGGF